MVMRSLPNSLLIIVIISFLSSCASNEPTSVVTSSKVSQAAALSPMAAVPNETMPLRTAPIPAFKPKPPKRVATAADYREVGVASWYGRPFHGRRTASGRIYDMHAMTAAHRTLPLGTRLRVTNLANRRSTVVVVNDRGPYVKGRIIDVSMRVAAVLGFKRRGVAKVRLEIVV